MTNAERPVLSSPRSLYLTVVVLLTYALSRYGWSHHADLLPAALENTLYNTGYFRYCLWWGALPISVTALFLRKAGVARELGLEGGFGEGLRVAFICCLPMLIGYAWLAEGRFAINFGTFLYGCVEAAFFEEIMFRAFVFGLLYRRAGWGLWPATLLDGLIFGLIHLSQGETMLEALGVFGVTAAGGVGFSVLYKEWNWNLWVPVFLHFFMNFYWMSFDVANNALGGAWANVFRCATVVLIIGWTIHRARRVASGTASPAPIAPAPQYGGGQSTFLS